LDGGGVHTIADSGEEIEYCRICRRGLFNIGAVQYFFKGCKTGGFFNAQSPPFAQPKVQGKCPCCHQGAVFIKV
jgi:hypothetical protein